MLGFGVTFSLIFWLVSSTGQISDTKTGKYTSLAECTAAGELLENNLRNAVHDKYSDTHIVWSCTQSPTW